MRKAIRLLAGVSLGLALAGCGGEKQDAAPPAAETSAATETGAAATAETAAAPTAAATVAAGAKPAAFAQCAACHAVEAGKHGIGPSLFGVYGTKAGEIAGYAFSDKLKASGLTWDDATLDKWLSGPMKLVPGTKMSYAGMSDAAKRAEIIAYMKTLK